MAAQNNADWYAMMWDIRGLRYLRDAHGFRAIDPPPPYHSWVTAIQGAPIAQLIAPLLDRPGFGVKDASGQFDLSDLALRRLISASWLWHPPDAGAETHGWEQITTPAALARWEVAWRDSSPADQRQFPDAILAREDVSLWGRKAPQGYDAGVIANLSEDCVGLSNLFGTKARPAATALCAGFGGGLPLVGYEWCDDLTTALASGWKSTGDLAVWVKPDESCAPHGTG
ncbi:hypothetical protein [Loktanella sp. Alg231-35]|uniref:hypothetical protein n=1 Tax=Loktanella sp. Alg231-35 TaxID=1922220 RepID=UPI000D55F839|nr:hypothetical protein [Loktanella sp. Alg231-35]